MSTEEKVTEQINEYARIGKENKNVDVGRLMMHALEQAHRDEMEAKKRSKAYLISIFMPPLGYFVAAWYALTSAKDDAKKVAINCVILTSVSLFITWLIGHAILSSVPEASTNQLQSINAMDQLKQMQELTQ